MNMVAKRLLPSRPSLEPIHFLNICASCSLLIAQNCIGKSPGIKIMQDFYRRNKARNLPVPRILGVSASPITNSKLESVERIEEALDSIWRSPKKSRVELLQHVEMPEFLQILYKESPPAHEVVGCTRALASLHKIYSGYDIEKDPYIIRLQADQSERSQNKLEKLLMNHKTWCFEQLKSFCATSVVICRELGAWAADFYIDQVVSRFTKFIKSDSSSLEVWVFSEKRYLCELLQQIEFIDVTSETLISPLVVSDKVEQLIIALIRYRTSAGIVFVQQRATVAVLAHLLSVHPHTKTSLRIGTMVGASDHSKRSKYIGELIEPKEQRQTLDKFKTKDLDLVIATTVLEEVIDIPACNIVICFDQPANLKSFVQRRGRARMKESKLVLMQSSTSDKLRQWHELEAEMKIKYADDMRELRAIA